MKTLIIADVYPPEISSAAHLMAELAEELAKRNHEVTVLTSYPRHYLTAHKKEQFNTVSKENGVRVIRVRTLPLHKVNFIIRGFSSLFLPFIFFSKLKRIARSESFDRIIVYSPPLTLGITGWLAKKKYNARLILNLQDIFPQNAVDLGVLKVRFVPFSTPILKYFFERIELFVYSHSDFITFHSEGGMKFLIEKKKVPPSKIRAIPNWIDMESGKVVADGSFRRMFGLEGKFVFLFGGIFGPAQGLEFLARVADRVKDLEDVVFLLVGDGTEKEKIEKLKQELHIKNLLLQPFVSGKDYPQLVADSDVGIVCLSSKNKTPFIPGKFLGYLAAGKPVFALLNKESDGFGLVRDAMCGFAVSSDDVDEAEKVVRKIYAEKGNLKKMGESGYAYARAHLSRDIVMEKIEELLR